MSFFPYAVVSASPVEADEESADQTLAFDNSALQSGSHAFGSSPPPAFVSSGPHQSWGASSAKHSSLSSRQYAAAVRDTSADAPVSGRNSSAGSEGRRNQQGIEGGRWEDASAGLCPPTLPRDVQVVGSSSVRSVSSSNSGHDDPGSSSMLFYPGSKGFFGSAQSSFISGASATQLQQGESGTEDLMQAGGVEHPRTLGKGQLRSRGLATGYDHDVYFLAEDEEDGLSGEDGMKHRKLCPV